MKKKVNSFCNSLGVIKMESPWHLKKMRRNAERAKINREVIYPGKCGGKRREGGWEVMMSNEHQEGGSAHHIAS